MPAPWWSPRADGVVAGPAGEVKARAAVRARVGPYAILDSLSPARARLQSPLEHVDGAQSKRPTTHRAEQIPPSGTLPEGVVFKQ